MERLAYLFLASLITLLNFRKLYLFLMLKVPSCKSENLSFDSPIYDILEVHSTLVRFYHNVQYKQRKIRSYGKVEWFSIKITNLMDIFQIHHKYFNNYLSIAFQLPWLYHQGYKYLFSQIWYYYKTKRNTTETPKK